MIHTRTAMTKREFKLGSNPIFLEIMSNMNVMMSVVTTATEFTRAWKFAEVWYFPMAEYIPKTIILAIYTITIVTYLRGFDKPSTFPYKPALII